MATTSPTPNYGWKLPTPGGSIGSWGSVLNEVLGGQGSPLGIDGVLANLRAELGDAESDLDSLESRVDTLEAAGTSAYYGRIFRQGSQMIPKGSLQKVEFNAVSYDQGGIVDGASFKIPEGAGGAWAFRAKVTVPLHTGSGDDGRQWRVEIHRNGQKASLLGGDAHTPYLNDGVSSDSGDITLTATYSDAPDPTTGHPGVEAGDVFTVHVYQTFFGGGDSAASLKGDVKLLIGNGLESATWFEAIRLFGNGL